MLDLNFEFGFTYPSWHRDSACQEFPAVDWFPEKGQSNKPAIAAVIASIVALYIANRNHKHEVEAAIDRRQDQLDDEARRRDEQEHARVVEDLDQTRRLIYMLLPLLGSFAPPAVELSASVFNALLHHSSVITEPERRALEAWAARGFPNGRGDLNRELRSMLIDIIGRITEELGDGPAPDFPDLT